LSQFPAFSWHYKYPPHSLQTAVTFSASFFPLKESKHILEIRFVFIKLNNGSSVSFLLVLILQVAFLVSAARKLAESDQTDQQPLLFRYHNGPLRTGNISINLIWDGKFKPSQRAIVTDFTGNISINFL
jgi:hypothetical protein